MVAGRTNPQQPSGPLKPKTNVSDTSEPAASPEAAIRRMSVEDMSRPLDGMPAGTTSAHIVPAGERHNKMPIFVSRITDTRDFLTWLRAPCPSSLTAQMEDERLMIVPGGTADGFGATVGWPCTWMSRQSLPRPASQRCLLATYKYTSAT